MKANRIARSCAALVVPVLVLALTASCAERRVEPAPTPTPPPARAAPPPPPRPTADWRDAPITPGDWSWAMEGSNSVARFAGGLLVLSCDRAAGTVTLLRQGAAEGDVPMTILTSSLTQPISGHASAGPPPAIAITFAARDSLLDAIAFSRGRFGVETAAMPPLYAPSWPEVSRVIEDCRQVESAPPDGGAKSRY